MDTREVLVHNVTTLVADHPNLAPASRRRFPRHSRRQQRMISVIIPAHNEEAYLKRTLRALHRQNYAPFEIIVVANGCDDRTADVARGRCHQLIVLSQKGLGVARNLGARMARGEILVFLDADTMLERKALRMIARNFSAEHAAGTLKGVPDPKRMSYRFIYFLKNTFHRTALHAGSSGVIICWKKHFMGLGGFDEALEVRENSELMRRLKRFGKYRYVGNAKAVTSMRRYDRCGILRMTWLWTRLWLQSFFSDLRNRQYETVR